MRAESRIPGAQYPGSLQEQDAFSKGVLSMRCWRNNIWTAIWNWTPYRFYNFKKGVIDCNVR